MKTKEAQMMDALWAIVKYIEPLEEHVDTNQIREIALKGLGMRRIPGKQCSAVVPPHIAQQVRNLP